MKPVKAAIGIQYAALPYRIQARQVQILLITSRGTQRWVIPKGWPMRGLKPQDAAAIEASEEAGLVGEIEPQPLGSYHYLKRLKTGEDAAVQVIVFAFRVSFQAEAWKEQGQRELRWVGYRRAAQLVAEPALSRLIRDFGAARTPTLLARGLRSYRNWRLARA
ncbi:MAG TPA: NUDIX hydrolase [Caulobacteraceae bacterium]|jgi:8-oxo-dGTP pyrophosphatase MutT (NUDIX family)